MKTNNMKLKINKYVGLIISMVLISIILSSCENEITPSLWEDKPKGETPVINTLLPSNLALAGVTNITIFGANFSTDAQKNIVYFNSEKAEILESFSDKLIVKAPNLISNDVKIKIAVQGVELFSNDYNYQLIAAVSEVYPFKTFEQAFAMTTDKAGNLYFSMVSDNIGQGIKKITTDGKFENFAPKGSETFYTGLRYGNDGALYGVRNLRAVFRVAQGVAPTTFAVLDNGVALFDLDFDKNNNLWTGGSGGKIFSVTSTKVIKSFTFEPRISSMRVFEDYLYVSASTETEENIWRFKINSADNLGSAEKYFEFTKNLVLPAYSIKSITFAKNGDLFIGTNSNKMLIRVKPDGTSSEWYKGLLYTPFVNMTWGPDANLYFSRGLTDKQTQSIIKVNMEQLGAPYYGRD